MYFYDRDKEKHETRCLLSSPWKYNTWNLCKWHVFYTNPLAQSQKRLKFKVQHRCFGAANPCPNHPNTSTMQCMRNVSFPLEAFLLHSRIKPESKQYIYCFGKTCRILTIQMVETKYPCYVLWTVWSRCWVLHQTTHGNLVTRFSLATKCLCHVQGTVDVRKCALPNHMLSW